MRVFSASLSTESNSFSPVPTELAAFHANSYFAAGRHPPYPTHYAAPLWAARMRGQAEGWTLIEGMVAGALSGGITTRHAHETLRDELLTDLRAALPLDMVLLGLHGGMLAEGCDDCEGDLLQRVRAIVGPATVIGAALDPHGHLSQAMVEAADLLVACQEYPHTDMLARAVELVDLCARLVTAQFRPCVAVADCAMIVRLHSTEEPACSYLARVRQLQALPGVLSISVMHGFPWGDVADMGTKLLVYTVDQPMVAARLARLLADELVALRDGLHLRPRDIDAALDEALACAHPPVLLADGADNPGGGAAGDATFILRRLLERGIGNVALGPLWDPATVRTAFEAGAGARLWLRIGGKSGPRSGEPLDLFCSVRALQPQLWMGAESGARLPLGDCALVEAEGIAIVLSSLREQARSPDLFTQLGCELGQRRLIVLKSSQHYRAGFSAIGRHAIYVDSPGSLCLDLRQLPYRKRRRPLWPLD